MSEDLFDIVDMVEQVFNAMEKAEDEGDTEQVQKLENSLLEMDLDRDQKVEALCLKYKNRAYLANAKRAEGNAMLEGARKLEKQNDRLLGYITFLLEGKKFETAKCKVSFRNTPSVTILDEQAVPEKFWKAGKPTIAKELIKEAIKNGEEVAGAIIETKTSASIR